MSEIIGGMADSADPDQTAWSSLICDYTICFGTLVPEFIVRMVAPWIQFLWCFHLSMELNVL